MYQNVLTDCLTWLVDVNLSEHDYEPKGQEPKLNIFQNPTSPTPIPKTPQTYIS